MTPFQNSQEMAEESPETRILANLVTQMRALAGQPANEVNAVSVKLPEFWIKSPEVWFVRFEAQFGTKVITQDQTKYDYVVSTLHINTKMKCIQFSSIHQLWTNMTL